MRSYYNPAAEMHVYDHRNDLLSTEEMDLERRKLWGRYADLKPDVLAKIKTEKQRERAEVLIPYNIFSAGYQQELTQLYQQFLMTVATMQNGKRRYTPYLGWKTVYQGAQESTDNRIDFYFQEPSCSEKNFLQGFIKKIPRQALDVRPLRERMQTILETASVGDVLSENPQDLKTVSIQEVGQTIFFIDSRNLRDIMDFFQDEGQIMKDQAGNLMVLEHPLLKHNFLFQLDQKPYIIPIRLLKIQDEQNGYMIKSEVLDPEKKDCLYSTLDLLKGIFSIENGQKNN